MERERERRGGGGGGGNEFLLSLQFARGQKVETALVWERLLRRLSIYFQNSPKKIHALIDKNRLSIK